VEDLTIEQVGNPKVRSVISGYPGPVMALRGVLSVLAGKKVNLIRWLFISIVKQAW